MGIILLIIIGGIAGWIASKIVGTDAQQGILLNIVFGVIGAFLGGWLATLFNLAPNMTEITSLWTWIFAILGAVIVTFIAASLMGGRSRV